MKVALPGAIPAATLILFRDGPAGPEHLFVERAAAMRFAGGAVVFPGGRIEPGDLAFAERFTALDPDDAASRIAAIRETIEEAGVGIGFAGNVAAVRAGLTDGRGFAALLDAQGVTLDLDALVPFARWCPQPGHHHRTFDTRFYLARANADVATVDATENVHLFWATAAEVLARADAGSVRIIFPTRRNLERLAALESFEAAVDHARATPLTTVTPWIEHRADGDMLCIAPALGYAVTEEPLATAFRL